MRFPYGARYIFEEIRSKYVNYSNIGGALCQLRDIRQSAESYRINMKKKKRRKREKDGTEKDEEKETKIYLRVSLIIARETKPLMLYFIELSYQNGKESSVGLTMHPLFQISRIYLREYFPRNTNRQIYIIDLAKLTKRLMEL